MTTTFDWPPTVTEASRALATGRATATALVEDSLARIAALDPALRSFVRVTATQARAAARAADRAIKAGRRRGPLHGVPFALKDIIGTAGIRTTAGSYLLEHHAPKRNATIVQRLLDAGAVLVGKLGTHEFATGGPAFDLPFPPPRNPWDTARGTSGSSSGSAVAVAAGLVPFALGTDTGGSIRAPAALSGIAGFKPTYGLVPRTGVVPLAFSMDHCGPMAWTSRDCALVLDAIAGHDGDDPASAAVAPSDHVRALRGGVAGMRIGVIRHFHERDVAGDPRAGAALDAALGVLRRLGAKIVGVKLPPFADWDACARIIIQAEALAVHRRDLERRPGAYARVTATRLLAGVGLSAADYVDALRWRRQLSRTFAAALEDLDAVVTCTSLALAPAMADAVKPPYFGSRGPLLTPPFSLIGVPALSVCMGFADGLPFGMQIAGRAFDDATVLRVGAAYERATPWRDRRPPPPKLLRDPARPERHPDATLPARRHVEAARAAFAAMKARLPRGFAYGDEPADVFRP
ncbi:MAG: amidase [Alphaproteobacteria bacterium]|nr:amidase [Alphaproteobacteria bacterium]